MSLESKNLNWVLWCQWLWENWYMYSHWYSCHLLLPYGYCCLLVIISIVTVKCMASVLRLMEKEVCWPAWCLSIPAEWDNELTQSWHRFFVLAVRACVAHIYSVGTHPLSQHPLTPPNSILAPAALKVSTQSLLFYCWGRPQWFGR